MIHSNVVLDVVQQVCKKQVTHYAAVLKVYRSGNFNSLFLFMGNRHRVLLGSKSRVVVSKMKEAAKA